MNMSMCKLRLTVNADDMTHCCYLQILHMAFGCLTQAELLLISLHADSELSCTSRGLIWVKGMG